MQNLIIYLADTRRCSAICLMLNIFNCVLTKDRFNSNSSFFVFEHLLCYYVAEFNSVKYLSIFISYRHRRFWIPLICVKNITHFISYFSDIRQCSTYSVDICEHYSKIKTQMFIKVINSVLKFMCKAHKSYIMFKF